MTLPGAQESLTLRSLAPAYCASFTPSAKATVFRMRARSSSTVCSLSSCLGGVCPESQAAAALTYIHLTPEARIADGMGRDVTPAPHSPARPGLPLGGG